MDRGRPSTPRSGDGRGGAGAGETGPGAPRRWLAFTARLRPGARERARELIGRGPPLELDGTGFDAHQVFLSNTDVVFVFESRGERQPVRVSGESAEVLRALRAWNDVLETAPVPAEVVFSWRREPPRGA
jgi:hypothetical protein